MEIKLFGRFLHEYLIRFCPNVHKIKVGNKSDLKSYCDYLRQTSHLILFSRQRLSFVVVLCWETFFYTFGMILGVWEFGFGFLRYRFHGIVCDLDLLILGYGSDLIWPSVGFLSLVVEAPFELERETIQKTFCDINFNEI